MQKRGYEVGIQSGSLYQLEPCPACGKKRWVQIGHDGKPISHLCVKCKQKKGTHWNWKGGSRKTSSGYRTVRVYDDDLLFPMASMGKHNKTVGEVLEHRLIMARHLGRCLQPWEVVHHKNGIKDDNRVENLELLPESKFHLPDLVIKSQVSILENENKKLRDRVCWLEQQLAKSQNQLI